MTGDNYNQNNRRYDAEGMAKIEKNLDDLYSTMDSQIKMEVEIYEDLYRCLQEVNEVLAE